MGGVGVEREQDTMMAVSVAFASPLVPLNDLQDLGFEFADFIVLLGTGSASVTLLPRSRTPKMRIVARICRLRAAPLEPA
jgi:hypothetical protein